MESSKFVFSFLVQIISINQLNVHGLISQKIIPELWDMSWVVSIGSFVNKTGFIHRSMGALIGDKVVLSSASASQWIDGPIIDAYVSLKELHWGYRQFIKVKRFLSHPGYKLGKNHNNIAILVLSDIPRNVSSISVPLSGMVLLNASAECIITGWNHAAGAPATTVDNTSLMYIREIFQSGEDCHKQDTDAVINPKVMFCTEFHHLCKMTENNELGSPFMCNISNRWYAFGILSFIHESSCSQNVFTSLTKYLSWIKHAPDWLQNKDTDQEMCTIYVNKEITGHLLEAIHDQPQGACCQLCMTIPACTAYTWNHTMGGTCWLKTGNWSFTEKQGVSAVTVAKLPDFKGTSQVIKKKFSHPEYRENSNYNIDGCFEHGKMCSNETSSKAIMDSFCTTMGFFEASSWNTTSRSSSKKDIVVNNNSTAINGSNAGCNNEGCYEVSQITCIRKKNTCAKFPVKDITGHTLYGIISQPFSYCCKHCQAEPACKAYSWNSENNGTCWLKDALNSLDLSDTSNVGYITNVMQATDGPCPSGWSYFAAGKKCYHIPERKATFVNTQQHCRLLGGTLAEIHSEKLTIKLSESFQDFLVNFLSKYLQDTWWIGVNDIDGLGIQRWKNGKLFHNTNDADDSDELLHESVPISCSLMYYASNNLQWTHENCQDVNKFICEIQLHSLVTEEKAAETEATPTTVISLQVTPPLKGIAHGKPALPEKYPWIVSLRHVETETSKPRHICTGTIIKDDAVLSAASCFYSDDNVAKQRNLDSLSIDTFDGLSYKIKSVSIHKNYNALGEMKSRLSSSASVDRIHSDVAVAHLGTSIEDYKTILLASSTTPMQLCLVAGWGKYYFISTMKEVSVSIVNHCETIWQNLDKSMICAGNASQEMEQRIGPCPDVVGAPLVCWDGDIPYLVGVSSFGSFECLLKPSVFTSVALVKSWIDGTLKTLPDDVLQDADHYILIIAILLLFCVLTATAAAIWYFHYRKRSKNYTTEFSRILKDQIVMKKKIGEGHFCEVWKGTYHQMKSKQLTVAVKLLKLNAEERGVRQFLEEALILGKLQKEKNIIRAYGLCQESKPYLLVLEYLDGGSLLRYLQSDTNRNNLNNKQLMQLVKQVNNACCCLERMGYIHRDIAARNCLVDMGKQTGTSKLREPMVKLADFGLAKDEKAIYQSSDPELAVAWTAPEGFDGMFSTKSDVWSFGVLVWEVFSFGAEPFGHCSKPSCEHICPNNLLNHGQIRSFVQLNTKTLLDMPDPCTAHFSDSLREIMGKCWGHLPDMRPSFQQLKLLLNEAEETIGCTDEDSHETEEPTPTISAQQPDVTMLFAGGCGDYGRQLMLNHTTESPYRKVSVDVHVTKL